MRNSLQSDKKIQRSELRNFGFVLGCGILLLFGLFFPWLQEKQIQFTHWPWVTASVLVIISLCVPVILKPVQRIWLFIGEILGFVNTRIILGVIFLMVFIPTALVLKILRKDLLLSQLQATAKSYRVDSAQPKLKNLNRPY